MSKQKISVNHDKVADVLYIVFGEARPSYAEDVGDGIYARYDMETDQLTGITILDFSKRSKSDLFNQIVSENILSEDAKESLDFLH